MADTGVVRVGSNVTEDVRVVSGTEVATFGAVAVVSGVASCWEIFTGTVAGAETSTGTVVTGGSCAVCSLVAGCTLAVSLHLGWATVTLAMRSSRSRGGKGMGRSRGRGEG